jgi:acetyl esterase/lipase
MKFIKIVTVLIWITAFCDAQEVVMYKQIDTTQLYLEVYKPAQMYKDSTYPAMIFYFGGGWNSGTRQHFVHHAKYFSKKGIVCFLADYRIKNIHKTSPFECLSDAKSAIRFVRTHADSYQIDTAKIIASGGSAGGIWLQPLR